MWCRALLAVLALACTLRTTAQAQTIKDIICVLIINGLQKEDLDVNILKKLQRHNVNIDDVNNETFGKDCANTGGANKQLTVEENPHILSTKNEEPKKLSESNLQNIIINYFHNAQKTSKSNEGEKLKITESNTNIPIIEHFLDAWSENRKENAVTIKKLEDPMVVTQRTTISNTRAVENKSIDYINSVLLSFIASQQYNTTVQPTTKKVDYDFIAQKLKEILANDNNIQSTTTAISSVVGKTVDAKINEEIDKHKETIRYMNDIQLPNQLKVFGSLRDQMSSNTGDRFEDKNVQYRQRPNPVVDVVPMKYFPPNDNPQYTKQGTNTQVLSEDIIRELSESVRAKVLEDLKRVITITTQKSPSTVKIATDKSITLKTTKKPTTMTPLASQANDTSKFMENLMKMFQQFKLNTKTTKQPKKAKVTVKGKSVRTKHNTPAELPYTYNAPVNITTVIMNPYIPAHIAPILQSALPNEFSLLNINTPLHYGADGKPLAKITQLNIFNTKNNYQAPPITIQTNSVEVPPLGLVAPESSKIVYQNIVVPKIPIEKMSQTLKKKQPKNTINHERYRTKSNHESIYDTNRKYKEPKIQHNYSNDKDVHYALHDRNRHKQYIDDHYKHEPMRHEDNSRMHYEDRSIERFHEKLERVDDWPQISRERYIDGEYVTPDLTPRHQVPLNVAKKRQRYDNTHFRNFLKTQQKVNDMLEKMLASKTRDGPRSVETTI